MESIKNSPIIFHHPDTMQVVRKAFKLDKPGYLNECIDIFQEWVRKQPHFRLKEFPRDMLEILIIRAKGSVEQAKNRLDMLCSYRTLSPKLFGVYRARDLKDTEYLTDAILPKLTSDHYRIMMLQNKAKHITDVTVQTFFKRVHSVQDYLLCHDYAMGFILVVDYRELDLLSLISLLTKPETRQGLATFFKCYAARVKQIHVLTLSKIINVGIFAFKQVISPDLFERIYVHKNVESLHVYLEKDLLPEDFGGKEKPLKKICENCVEFFSTDEHLEYMREMSKATIDVNVKQKSCKQS